MHASTDKVALRDEGTNGEATSKEADDDEELSTPKVAILLVFKVVTVNTDDEGGSKPLRT